VGEHVRNHGDDGPRDVPAAAPWRRVGAMGGRQRYRGGAARPAGGCVERGDGAGGRGGGWGDGRTGSEGERRVLEASGANGGAVFGGQLRRGDRRAGVPDWGSGEVCERGRDRVHGQERPAGEGARVSHRTGGDRSSTQSTSSG